MKLYTIGFTQKSARDFSLRGINVIGVPKTIDNDVACTEVTFGNHMNNAKVCLVSLGLFLK